jgi:hypothetical protein
MDRNADDASETPYCGTKREAGGVPRPKDRDGRRRLDVSSSRWRRRAPLEIKGAGPGKVA